MFNIFKRLNTFIERFKVLDGFINILFVFIVPVFFVKYAYDYYTSPQMGTIKVPETMLGYNMSEEYIIQQITKNINFISNYNSTIKNIYGSNNNEGKSNYRTYSFKNSSISNVKVNLSGVEFSLAPLLNLIYEHPRQLDIFIVSKEPTHVTFSAKYGSKNFGIYDSEWKTNTLKEDLDILIYKFSIWYLELNEPELMIDYYKAIKNDSMLISHCMAIIGDYSSQNGDSRPGFTIRMKRMSAKKANKLLAKTYQAMAYAQKTDHFSNASDMITLRSDKFNYLRKALEIDPKNYESNYSMYLFNSTDTLDNIYKKKCLKLDPSRVNNIYFLTDSLNMVLKNQIGEKDDYKQDARLPNELEMTGNDRVFINFINKHSCLKSSDRPKMYYEIASYYSTLLDIPLYVDPLKMEGDELRNTFKKASSYLSKAITYELDSMSEIEYNNLSEYYNKLAYVNEQYFLNWFKNNNYRFSSPDTIHFYLGKQYYYCQKAFDVNKNNFWAYSTLAEYYAIKYEMNRYDNLSKDLFLKNKERAERLSNDDYDATHFKNVMPYKFVDFESKKKLTEREKLLLHLNGTAALVNN